MSRSASITKFFRPVDRPNQRKRPYPTDSFEAIQENLQRKNTLSSSKDHQETENETGRVQCSTLSKSQPLSDADPSLSSQALSLSQRSLLNRTFATSADPNEVLDLPTSSASGPRSSPREDSAEKENSLPTPVSTYENSARPHTTLSPSQNGSGSNDTAIPASQSLLTSSQRIFRKGQVMIRNSDDETDSADQSDSDDSLRDFDAMLEAQKTLLNVQSQAISQAPGSSTEGAQRTRRKGKTVAPKKESYIYRDNSPVPPKKYKYSLETLAKRRKQEDASSAAIHRARSMVEALDRQGVSSVEKKPIVDSGVLDTVLKEHGSEDNIGRLKAAIERTEAFDHDKTWSFFGARADEAKSDSAVFPRIEDERLDQLFADDRTRQQTFLSGFAGELASKGALPDEVMLWLMDSVCLESRDDLRYAYILTLRDAAESVVPLLAPDHINLLFREIGATATAVEVEIPIVPSVARSETSRAEARPSLLSVLTLLGSLSGAIGSASRIYILNVLCRLMLDKSVTKDIHASSAIEEVFASLVESIPESDVQRELHSVMTTAYGTINDAPLRLQLLKSIPTWSSRLIILRQRLALAFFYQNLRYLSRKPEALVNLQEISRHLQSSQFSVRNATDFAELAASVSILGIGIDDGNPPPSPLTKEAEKAFNAEVDTLALKVNSMFNDIVDTGASHMKKTESKEVLEGLQRRLEYAIRKRPKPRKLIFGDAKPSLAEQELMDAFVKRKEQSEPRFIPP